MPSPSPRGVSLLAEPHQQDGVAGERDYGPDAQEQSRLGNYGRALKPVSDGVCLERCQRHREIAGGCEWAMPRSRRGTC
jgi:hypothetical protein